MLMENYKHAVQPAIHRELTKIFIACKALHFIPVFFRFFLFLKLRVCGSATAELESDV